MLLSATSRAWSLMFLMRIESDVTWDPLLDRTLCPRREKVRPRRQFLTRIRPIFTAGERVFPTDKGSRRRTKPGFVSRAFKVLQIVVNRRNQLGLSGDGWPLLADRGSVCACREKTETCIRYDFLLDAHCCCSVNILLRLSSIRISALLDSSMEGLCFGLWKHGWGAYSSEVNSRDCKFWVRTGARYFVAKCV